MSHLRSLRELLISELKDLHTAENYLLQALPRLAKTAASEEAKQGFNERLEETKRHVNLLESALRSLETPGEGPAAPATADREDGEDYELAGYGTVRNFAELLEIIEITETLRGQGDEADARRTTSGLALACL